MSLEELRAGMIGGGEGCLDVASPDCEEFSRRSSMESSSLHRSVVQRPERRSPKPKTQVRVLPDLPGSKNNRINSSVAQPGRGTRPKPVSVSVRIRPELPLRRESDQCRFCY